MSLVELMMWISALGTVCWVPCFYWMHRISDRQDRLLRELREQGRRIEVLSRAEHDLIKEVHPQVGEIKESLATAIEEMGERRTS
jgi:hypothetical protein